MKLIKKYTFIYFYIRMEIQILKEYSMLDLNNTKLRDYSLDRDKWKEGGRRPLAWCGMLTSKNY